MFRPALIALPLVMLAACTPAERDENFVSKAPAASVVGEPETCITTSRIRSQTVHDDRTIDFRVGSKIYRNTLRASCSRLGFEEAITYDSYGSQLCRQQIVYVLESIGGNIQRGAPCSLGDFVPIEYIDRDKDVMQ